uniref:Uncharacterized protein n=1 Tax=Amphora coffeiformis TaxID=265554 RepID=A0A7S3P885_9STRA
MGCTNSKNLGRSVEISPSLRHQPSHKRPSPWRHLLDPKAAHKKAPKPPLPPTTAAMAVMVNVMLGGGDHRERASFGTRQARDPNRPTANFWTERPGWENSAMSCERRFSSYPDLVITGTNEAYEALKRRINAEPDDPLPLYLGAKLARNIGNDDPKDVEWRVRPECEAEICERCYSEFPSLTLRGTNEVYEELERIIIRRNEMDSSFRPQVVGPEEAASSKRSERTRLTSSESVESQLVNDAVAQGIY